MFLDSSNNFNHSPLRHFLNGSCENSTEIEHQLCDYIKIFHCLFFPLIKLQVYFEKPNSGFLHNFRVSHLVWSLLLKEDYLLFSTHLAVKPPARRSMFQTRPAMLFSIMQLCTTEFLLYASCATLTSMSIRDASLCLAKVSSSFESKTFFFYLPLFSIKNACWF